MSYRFVSKPTVTFDIEAIVSYYKNIFPDVVDAFLDRLEEAKKYISNYPVAFQVKYKNVRTLLLKQFPYHIHYIVDESKQQIIILAVVHAYKYPNYYSDR